MTYRFDIAIDIAGIAQPLASDATNHLPRARSGERGLKEQNR